jgi:hypothetical protein
VGVRERERERERERKREKRKRERITRMSKIPLPTQIPISCPGPGWKTRAGLLATKTAGNTAGLLLNTAGLMVNTAAAGSLAKTSMPSLARRFSAGWSMNTNTTMTTWHSHSPLRFLQRPSTPSYFQNSYSQNSYSQYIQNCNNLRTFNFKDRLISTATVTSTSNNIIPTSLSVSAIVSSYAHVSVPVTALFKQLKINLSTLILKITYSHKLLLFPFQSYSQAQNQSQRIGRIIPVKKRVPSNNNSFGWNDNNNNSNNNWGNNNWGQTGSQWRRWFNSLNEDSVLYGIIGINVVGTVSFISSLLSVLYC